MFYGNQASRSVELGRFNILLEMGKAAKVKLVMNMAQSFIASYTSFYEGSTTLDSRVDSLMKGNPYKTSTNRSAHTVVHHTFFKSITVQCSMICSNIANNTEREINTFQSLGSIN